MTLPFTIIYVHEVRWVDLDVAGLLMSRIAVVAVVVTGPVGILTDRLGAWVALVWGAPRPAGGSGGAHLRHQHPGARHGVRAAGVRFAAGWPAFSAIIVEGRLSTQLFGINFALLDLGIGGVVFGFLTDVEWP